VLELRPGGDGQAARPPLVYEGSYTEFVTATGSEAAGVHG
jgi:hypothetical protein